MNLLKEGIEQGFVIKTEATKKLVIDGLSDLYPVYKVRINHLFYNNQNDRIATWISEYETKHSCTLEIEKDKEQYNSIIHEFITKSKEDKLKETQFNISLFGQQEAGVVLSDGRVIDGNRRFTCLRNLAKNSDNFSYFETVILDKNYEQNEKQIKMLELQIQIGKEERVDYDPIDKLVGLYRDVELKRLLTVEEYGRSTNMKVPTVKKELEVANLMVEFLELINAPGQYYIARDLKLDGPLRELQRILKKIHNEDKREDFKNIAFTNMLMCPSKDLTRHIRKLATIAESKYADEFVESELETAEDVINSLPAEGKVNNDSISLLRGNSAINEKLNRTMEKFDNKAKISKSKNQPLQFMKKAIDNLSSVDLEIVKRLNEDQKSELMDSLEEIDGLLSDLKENLNV